MSQADCRVSSSFLWSVLRIVSVVALTVVHLAEEDTSQDIYMDVYLSGWSLTWEVSILCRVSYLAHRPGYEPVSDSGW